MKKSKLIILIALPILFVILISNVFSANLSPYMSVSEVLKEKPYGRNVQVIGEAVLTSIYFDMAQGILTFQITDEGSFLEIKHEGIINNLQNSTEVVVIGEFKNDGYFYADDVLVKCPSKYEETPITG
jgi:cytochrome c-type biogenesis protein CcmE